MEVVEQNLETHPPADWAPPQRAAGARRRAECEATATQRPPDWQPVRSQCARTAARTRPRIGAETTAAREPRAPLSASAAARAPALRSGLARSESSPADAAPIDAQ